MVKVVDKKTTGLVKNTSNKAKQVEAGMKLHDPQLCSQD